MLLHLIAGADLDHRGGRKPVGRAASRHKYLKADAAGQLRRAADNVAARGGSINETPLLRALARAEHILDGRGTRFGDGAHRLFHNIGQAALLVARGGIGIPVHAAGVQIVVIPFHLCRQLIPRRGVTAPGSQQVHAVPNLGDLTEQDGGSALHQHVGRIARAGVRGDAGKGVRSAALHADEQLRQGQLLPTAAVEALQLLLRQFHQGVHHGAVSTIVLKNQCVFRTNVLRRQHHVKGKLFAPKPHHHPLSAKVGVPNKVCHRPDGNMRVPGLNGHAAAIGVVDGHHIVHIRILW
ncbi:hypothetical protein SDC9_150658 [bioreactor metagenome]|uniref:Uncharacterized protein n=1 Tax=bioreactor metagenome TaxID=1076179 RepID=A0A645EN29_9ZZZZ